MNSVNLIGRMTRDPEVRYTDSGLAVCRFSVAIDRGKDRNGDDRGVDFPNVVAFGRTAENVGKYCVKGQQVGVSGRIQTGKYMDSEGRTVYTTDVIASRIEFLGSRKQESRQDRSKPQSNADSGDYPGFEDIPDDDIPF